MQDAFIYEDLAWSEEWETCYALKLLFFIFPTHAVLLLSAEKKEEDKTTQGRLKIMEAFFLSIMGEYWRIVLGKTTKNN